MRPSICRACHFGFTALRNSLAFIGRPWFLYSAPIVAPVFPFTSLYSLYYARLFFQSQSEPEKNHLIDALRFELGKVKTVAVRERMVKILFQIDDGLATAVAQGLGIAASRKNGQLNHSVPADANPKTYESVQYQMKLKSSSALSMADTVKGSIVSRKIAVLTADGVNGRSFSAMRDAIRKSGGTTVVIAPHLGAIRSNNNELINVDESFLTAASVLYDAVYVPGGESGVQAVAAESNAIHFLNQAFKHCKVIAADEDALEILQQTYFADRLPPSNESVTEEGVLIGRDAFKLSQPFINAVGDHRVWSREIMRKVPA